MRFFLLRRQLQMKKKIRIICTENAARKKTACLLTITKFSFQIREEFITFQSIRGPELPTLDDIRE